MCGIAGFIDLQNNIKDQHLTLEAMNETLRYRGPDASGIWMSPHAALGHRRLIVVDPIGGSQPMVRNFGERTYVLTYNGELYNTLDLREELEALGHIFYTKSDTEVLLVSYIEWGTDCVDHLNGIYAFGVWDQINQSLFLARDRFGVKPLFYTLQNGCLIFASEIKALLAHPTVKPQVASDGLAEIFALGPARTPGHGVYKGIYEIKPACCAVYNHMGFKIHKYWSLKSQPHIDSLSDTLEIVHKLVIDSIERQFVSDVPVCTFLSGGLDSSIISALAANYFRKNYNKQLNTYSIDYVDNDKYFKDRKSVV